MTRRNKIMKCERCKKNEATFFYKESINGECKNYSLCAECAKEMQQSGELMTAKSPFEELNLTSPFAALGDSLFGSLFYPTETAKLGTGAKKCPRCHSTLYDFKERGKAGCSECYTAFAEELEPTVRSMHGSSTHTGRAPSKWRKKQSKAARLKELRRQMNDAIKKEEFEEAARLRDEIRLTEEKEDN